MFLALKPLEIRIIEKKESHGFNKIEPNAVSSKLNISPKVVGFEFVTK